MKMKYFRLFVVLCLLAAVSTAGFCQEAEKAKEEEKPKLGKWQQYWLDRVTQFEEENKTLDPAQKNIVFLGDSLTQAFKVKQYFPDLPVLNRGIGSDGVANVPAGKMPYRGVTHRLEESIFDCNPSHIFFMIGTNDVGQRSVPFEYWLGAHKYVTGRAKAKFPDVKIILMTCPPSGTNYKRHVSLNERILEWNEIIRKTAEEEGFRLLDVYGLLAGDGGLLPDEMTRDGLHFNSLGYDKIVAEVKKILKEDGVIKE